MNPERSEAVDVAAMILSAYEGYLQEFDEITRRAGERFVRRDWAGMRQDAVSRLGVYSGWTIRILSRVREILAESVRDDALWRRVKTEYARRAADRDDLELAETFYNSIVRRAFGVTGVNPGVEFTADDFEIPRIEDRACPVCAAHPMNFGDEHPEEFFRNLLAGHAGGLPFRDLDGEARRIAGAVSDRLARQTPPVSVTGVEIMDDIFYRDQAAYIIGRMRTRNGPVPLVIVLLHEDEGVFVDAVLLTFEEISILFSFTRSYFHVPAPHPTEMVNFLKTLLPRKRVSEIYTSIGFHKHGKAELFRELTRALDASSDAFEIARGEKGMVMLVFTLPSFDVVFKIIKDRFDYPKKTSRSLIRGRYELVFRHDRAGRLVDAQEFEQMEFAKDRFSEALLGEFRENAAGSVFIGPDRVVIRHLYTERRLIPLDVHLRESSRHAAEEAVVDYGLALRELAASNIFPGDLFLKNFGVTRHGRVVFYDYDELCLLTDCRFRDIPPARNAEDELADGPWFFVEDRDVFPEEFRTFLRFPEGLDRVFEAAHGDLFTSRFWRSVQKRLESGAVIPIFPYKESARIHSKESRHDSRFDRNPDSSAHHDDRGKASLPHHRHGSEKLHPEH